jgi:hypothetical protein
VVALFLAALCDAGAAARAQQASSGSPARQAPVDGAPSSASPRSADAITVRTSTDRTALWVGDRVGYTVELDCPPTLDVVASDFEKDKLRVEGLEVVDASTERAVELSGHAIYRFRYLVTAFDTSVATPVIADWTVRYGRRRAGGEVEDTAVAGDLRIPGVTLALRSTIPERVAAVVARDNRSLEGLPRALALARPVGLGLILVSAAPVVLWAVALVHRMRRPRVRRQSTRAVRRHSRAALEDLRPIDANRDEQRRQGFEKLDAILRQHLAEVALIPAPALTPAEIAKHLDSNHSALPRESIQAILVECERARFGPPDLLPSAERFREAVTAAEQVFSSSR